MSNIERRYAYLDEGVFPEEGEYGVTYLTLYSSNAGNIYDGWVYDPDNRVRESLTERTYGYRNPDYPQYCWDDEVVVDLSNAQSRQESSEYIQGRITSFNTNVSSRPIVLQDIDITGLTEEERENLATTVLFSAIPLVQDAYIQAQVEVQCKCNLSPDNTSGEMRIEAFYILNDESDRTMRPNPVHTFTVSSPNERHTLPWLYWNPALRHDDHNYIGVKLICTGGTAEIGISDNPDYGDAMITLASAGLTGDKIDSGKPVRIWIEGEQLVPLGYRIDINDYDVFCEYDTGEIYIVTHFCTFNPAIGEVVEENFTLQAWYMGLHAALRVQVALVDHIELMGIEDIHDSYKLNIKDYTVLGYLETGDIWDVTEFCEYSPAMGTVINATTTLTATFVNPGPLPVTDSLEITKHTKKYTKRATQNGLIYTLYDDDYLVISGSVSTNPQSVSDTKWSKFGNREGVVLPTNTSRYAKDNAYTIEWAAEGKPSCILFGIKLNTTNPDYNEGVYVERLINFAQMDCSEVLFADFSNQPHLGGANLRSINLSVNKLGSSDEYISASDNAYVYNAFSPLSSPLKCSNTGLDAFDNSHWDLSGIKYATGMLSGSANLKIAKLYNLTSVISTQRMFGNCPELETVIIDGLVYNPKDETTGINTSMQGMFYDDFKLKSIQITNADYTEVEDVSSIFFNCHAVEDDAVKLFADICSTPKKNLYEAFRNCISIRDLSPLSNIDLSKTESVARMFYGCIELIDISPLSGLDVSHIWNFTEMFYGDDKLRVISPLSGWDMFITERDRGTSNWDNSAIDIGNMFARSPKAAYLDDEFRSTHLLDANNLNWSGYKNYANRLWNKYVEAGLVGSSTKFSIRGVGVIGMDGPGWPGTPDTVVEISWDIPMSSGVAINDYQWEEIPSTTRWPGNAFGGTDWRVSTDIYHPGNTGHKESNVSYALPEWYIFFLNWVYNRNLPSDRDRYWNGDRDVPAT